MFCGGTPLTREHVLPRWLRKHLEYAEQTAVWTTGATGELESSSLLPIVPGERVVRRVCATCNNGWMSALETDAEAVLTPLLRGRSSLTRHQALRVSRWIYKTALVEQLLIQGGPRFAAADYARFAKDRGVNKRVSIHAATTPNPDVVVFNSADQLRADDGGQLTYHSTSFWLGRLLLRVEAGEGSALVPKTHRDRALGMVEIYPRFSGPDLPSLADSGFARSSRVQYIVDSGPEAWRRLL